MLSLNRATIIGNATRDPEMRYTPNGQAVSNFAVATNRRWTGNTGETQEQAEFHEIVAWGKLGEIVNQYIKKGAKVYVEGRIQTRTWEAPDGSRRQRTEIIAENVINLSPRQGFGGGEEYSSSEASSAPAASTPKPKKPISGDSGFEEVDLTSSKPKTEDKPVSKTEESSQDDTIDLDDIPF